MINYVNYRYQDFDNHSFQNEFRLGGDNYADFTGSRLKSCDFCGANLVDADFSETAIGRDDKIFQSQITQMVLHIIIGIPVGFMTWWVNQEVLGCGIGQTIDPYGWLTNPFTWIFAFATMATMSKRWLFLRYMALIGLMVFVAMISSQAAGVVGVCLLLVAFGLAIFGIYLGYKKGSIAVGTIWMTVGISSAISAGCSWLEYQEIHYAILFAILTIIPAILATRAFNLHFAKVKLSAMTSFNGADITNARFVNAVLENCDFLGANLGGVDWHGATFKNCKFPKGFSRDEQAVIADAPDSNLSIEKLTANKL
ncbi:MAG: hypothetical protein DCF19_06365 [Pseudanabaena frigida]|uniref:Pentapeptide repeat-containing protein n=1 Tax=Pseudanabaena frigida TaxID=945775 RepID=A0A2W4Y5G0_9CYAN|nr:MAG: hypothetical protein DCF19_06365 [Pseudanabaena frigida]